MSTASATKSKPRHKRALPPGMVKRGRKYHADFMKSGRRIRKPLSSNLDAAKEMLNELRSRADKGELQLLDNRYPWADLRKVFMAWAKQHIRDWQQYERSLSKFEAFTPIGNVAQVNAALIDQYRSWRLDQGMTPRTVNREVGTISNMLNKGVDRFKVIASNVLLAVKPLPHTQPTKVRRALTGEEVEAIFKQSPADLLPVFRLYATTGMRKNELVTLRFDDIDWDLQTVTIRAAIAKSKRKREIPLDDATVAMLRQLQAAAEARPEGWPRDLVFVSREGNPLRNNLLRRFYVVCKRAKIDDAKRNGSIDLHSLRVTFTSLALDGGANPKAVQAILGHSTLEMTMAAYAKATDRAKRETINALPFASASNPRHVVTMNSEATQLSPNSHKSQKPKLQQVG